MKFKVRKGARPVMLPDGRTECGPGSTFEESQVRPYLGAEWQSSRWFRDVSSRVVAVADGDPSPAVVTAEDAPPPTPRKPPEPDPVPVEAALPTDPEPADDDEPAEADGGLPLVEEIEDEEERASF